MMSGKSHILKRDADGRLFTYDEEYNKTKEKLSKNTANEHYLRFLSSKQVEHDFTWHLLKIAAGAIASDGVHQKEELMVCQEICNEFSIPWDKFKSDLENELASITNFDIDTITAYLKIAFQEADHINNSFLLFEVALHLILADGIMTQEECDLLANVGTLLHIPTGKMIARIGLFLREEKQTLVDVEESLKWHSTLYITE